MNYGESAVKVISPLFTVFTVVHTYGDRILTVTLTVTLTAFTVVHTYGDRTFTVTVMVTVTVTVTAVSYRHDSFSPFSPYFT